MKTCMMLAFMAMLFIACDEDDSTKIENKWVSLKGPYGQNTYIYGIIIDNSGRIITSEYYGAHRFQNNRWDSIGSDAEFPCAITPSQFIIAGTGMDSCSVVISTDDGVSWTCFFYIVNHGAYAILPLNDDDILMGVEDYGIWRTTNRGQSWFLELTGSNSVMAIAVDPRTQYIWALGGWGLYCKPPGGNWSWNADCYAGWASKIDFSSDSNIFVCSSNFLYRSTNLGLSWNTIEDSVHTFVIDSLNKIYTCRWSGGINRSTDNGDSWEVWGFPDKEVTAMVIDSLQIMYVAIKSEGVFKTYKPVTDTIYNHNDNTLF